MDRALVTGGGGYLGGKLCRYLLDNGCTSVTAFDVCYPVDDEEEPLGLKKIEGDICDYSAIHTAMVDSTPSIVYHLASYGMSGKEMLNKEKIESVNIQGTRNVINACIAANVQCLVYTSTYNVVFGGQEIRNGDESLPYFPLDKHVDNYSRTKAIAECMVLEANESKLENNGCGLSNSGRGLGYKGLRVCSLRCAGIYGEGERRHLPRIVSYIEKGLFSFTYGSKDSLVDFLHGDNFVLAHYLVGKALLKQPTQVAGKPYFISDGKPINNFMFFKPLVEGLGYTYPTMKLPLSLIFYLAFLIEIVHRFVSRYIYNFQPLLTRAEVFKTGVTHYFSIEAARRDFGYVPEPKTMDTVVKWFKERGHGKKKRKRYAVPSIVIVMLLTFVIVVLFFSVLPVAS